MPRPPRIQLAGANYHIVTRGDSSLAAMVGVRCFMTLAFDVVAWHHDVEAESDPKFRSHLGETWQHGFVESGPEQPFASWGLTLVAGGRQRIKFGAKSRKK